MHGRTSLLKEKGGTRLGEHHFSSLSFALLQECSKDASVMQPDCKLEDKSQTIKTVSRELEGAVFCLL